MSARILHVFVEDRHAGTLKFEDEGNRQHAIFQYGSDWLSANDRFTFDPALRLVGGPQFQRASGDASPFSAAIADTEPDGWGKRVILRDQTKRRERDRRRGQPLPAPILTPVDFLLAVNDSTRLGALRFQDEAGIFQRSLQPNERSAPPLVELSHLLAASRAVESDSETAADLAYLQGRGTSLGGMRPKCSVVDEDGRLSIGKFPSIRDTTAVTKAEVLALRLAREAGIEVARARLVNSGGLPVAIVERFDRAQNGARIPYISAATMLSVDPSEDQAYTDLVDALRIHGAYVQKDCEELWRRIAFSILITNVDDHLRNHGFLHVSRGQWRLAPAFDLNPNPDRKRELKTWISREAGPAASVENMLAVAPYFRIPRDRAGVILGEVENAVSRWKQIGKAIGMTSKELSPFTDAFEHPERDVARQAAAPRISAKAGRQSRPK